MLVHIGSHDESPEVIAITDTPNYQDSDFWLERTQEAETEARLALSETEIDCIFDDVASVIDEDLGRFDPLVAYYGRFLPDGDAARIEIEREAAHCIKRDLAWAAIERANRGPSFFSGLLSWYEQGRWPIAWAGDYPDGHVLVL